jgi:hypothetical protein
MTSVNEMLLEVENLLISCQDKKTWYKEGLELISKSSNQSNPEWLIDVAKAYLNKKPENVLNLKNNKQKENKQ